MGDIGTELRWILLIFSVALIAGLYIAGRWGRGQSADAAESNISRESRRESRGLSPGSFGAAAHLPQLDDVVSVRERHIEPHITILPDADIIADDLPDVNIDSVHADVVHTDSLQVNDQVKDYGARDLNTYDVDAPDARVAAPAMAVDHQLASVQADVREMRVDEVKPPEPSAAPPRAKTDEAVKRPTTRKIVALRLVSGAQRFDGAQLKDAFETAKLHHGKYGIYHRYDEQEVTVFSVASMVEPGTFDPPAMHNQQFQGVMLFAQLPGPMDGILMFEHMLEFAERLSNNLGGAIQDERGAVLTPQRAGRIRDEIEDFQHLLGIEPRAPGRSGEGIAAS